MQIFGRENSEQPDNKKGARGGVFLLRGDYDVRKDSRKSIR